MNIIKVTSNFPVIESPGVMPVDNPTVPKAETVSKSSWRNVNFSVTERMKTTTAIKTTDNMASVIAR